MLALVAALATGALGWAAGTLVLGCDRRTCPHAALRWPIGIAVALGLQSLAYTGVLVGAGGSLPVLAAAEAGLLVAAAAALRRWRAAGPPCTATWSLAPWQWGLLAVAGLATAWSVALRAPINPHGRWDAWAIWNLKARFLARVPGDWAGALSPEIPWSHPDYPWLLPATVARFWRLTDGEPAWIPLAVAVFFAAATAAVVTGGTRLLATPMSASLAGAVVVSTPWFAEHVHWQQADIPVAFFYVAALVLAALAWEERAHAAALRRSVAAGFLASAAAWTKNEGLFFVACFGAAWLVATLRGAPARRAAAALLGAAPVLAAVLAFKLGLAPPTDLWERQSETWGKLADPARYGRIGRALWDSWPVLPAALLALHRIGRRANGELGPPHGLAAALVPAGMGIAFLGVFVVTPHELDWHLVSALDRLLGQLWPMAVLLLLAAAPRGAGRAPPRLPGFRSSDTAPTTSRTKWFVPFSEKWQMSMK